MSYTTGVANGAFGEPLTIEKIMESVEKLKAIPQNKTWIVVTPSGQVVTGEFDAVFNVMMRSHPYMKQFDLGVPYAQP